MKKIISVLIIVLMIASLVAAAVNVLSYDDEEYVRSGDNGNVIVPYTTGTGITIDGTLSRGEWSETNKLSLDGKITMKSWGIGVFEGTIDFYYSWGDAGLYIAAVIYDDQIADGASDGGLATRFMIGLNPAGIICDNYAGLFFSLTPLADTNDLLLRRHNWRTQADDGYLVGEDEGYTGKYTFIRDDENVVGWNLECVIPWDMIATGDRYTDLDETDEIYLTNFNPKDANQKRAFCTATICYVQHFGPESSSITSTARTATDGYAGIFTTDSYDITLLFALPGETDRTTETEYFTNNKEPNEITQPVTADTETETEPVSETDTDVIDFDNVDKFTLIDFSRSESVNGINSNDCKVTYDKAEGAIKVTVTGTDPFFYIPMKKKMYFDGDKFCILKMEYKTDFEGTSEFFYTTKEVPSMAYCNLQYELEATGGEYKVFECDMQESANWTGEIRNLRIDPAAAGEEGQVFYFRNISFEVWEASETEVPATTEIEPTTDPAGVAGDINGDGEVNNKDVVTLFRYVSGVKKEKDESVYDYNGDGEVNNKDVVALFRFLSTAGEGTTKETEPVDKPEETKPEETKPEETKPGKTENADYLINPGTAAKADLFKGQTLTILANSGFWPADDLWREEDSEDPIDSAIYNRSKSVESKYGFSINVIEDPTVVVTLKNAYKSGLRDYDVAALCAYEACPLAAENIFCDLTHIENLNLNKGYWDQGLFEGLSIDNKLFYATGDISTKANAGTFLMMFNKKLAADYGLGNLYQVVRDGNWTLDYLNNIIKEHGYHDYNGDSKVGVEDVYGMGIQFEAYLAFYFGAGGRMILKDADEMPYLTINTEKNLSIINMIYDLTQTDNKTIDAHDHLNEPPFSIGEGFASTLAFKNNRCLFYNTNAANMLGLRDMDADFGVLPTPKYDKTQQNYNSYAYHGATLFVIPVMNNHTAFAGFALEALCAESYKTVTPAYYGYLLEGKIQRDEDSYEMLDIVFRNRVWDLGYFARWGGIDDSFIQQIKKGTSTFAKWYKSASKSATKAINKFIDSYNNSST